MRRTPVELLLSAGKESMELSRSVNYPPFPHSLPAAQEAAVLYANGREADAADFLRSVLEPGGPGSETPDLWYMLFDLLRARSEWKQYEALAARFEGVFGTPAPAWLNEEEMARLPADVRPGGVGYFELRGALDSSRSLELDRVRAAARNLTTVHLDVSRLAAIDSQGCAALLELMRFMPENGNGLVLTGADHLAHMLREAAEGNPSDDAYWGLLLELYRVCGRQADFERAALEYALAAGTTPPAWQPVMMPVAPQAARHEKRDEPRYQPGPEAVYLNGVMWGAADPQIAGLRTFGEERQYVNINLSQLRRMDFNCGTAFATLVNDLAAAGMIVRLIRPNRLVAAFLSTLSLDSAVKLVLPVRRPE
jgi:ABC-type transporter Mla MlaB component